MKKKTKKIQLISFLTMGLLGLTSCSGTLANEDAATGEGFEFGASQEEVDAVIADLEPVTLTFQPYSASAEGSGAAGDLAFINAVEERSGGKIQLDVAWGQSIAPHTEVGDALVDGRLDLAVQIPVYSPNEYPMVDAYNKLSQYTNPAPLTGEAATHAQMSEAGWKNTAVLEEYESKGIIPLNPLVTSGNYWAACSSPHNSLDDWKGSQLRIAGSGHIPVAENLGATPVSMEYGETFEALQRGTVDCTFIQSMVAAPTGLLEAAPYVSTLAEGRQSGSVTTGHVAGPSFNDLPLAYQQIIFDAVVIDFFHGQLEAMLTSSVDAVQSAQDAGGEFYEFDSESEKRVLETQEELVDELIADGRIDEADRQNLQETAAKWENIVEELGYTDGGSLNDIGEWYIPEDIDFRPLAERVFEEAAHEHRPS